MYEKKETDEICIMAHDVKEAMELTVEEREVLDKWGFKLKEIIKKGGV